MRKLRSLSLKNQKGTSKGKGMKQVLVFGLFIFILGGCGAKTLQREPDLFWPPPPEIPRIKFIRTISSSSDVEKKSFSDRLKSVLFGGKSGAALVKPYAVFTTPDGRVYVADSGWRKVLVFDPKRERFFMIGVDGPGALAGPLGVTADENGRIYVTDSVLRKCFVYDAEGKYLFDMGDLNRLERPVGVAVNNKLKRVYIADTRKHRIFVFDMEGNFLFEFGKRGNKDGEFNFPANLFIDTKGKIYITDMNFRVQIFDPEGKYLSQFGSVGTGFGQFSLPKGIGVDSQGNIYVVDSRFNNVQIFRPDGRLLLFFGEFGGEKGQFWLPAGLTIDKEDRIYVADQYNHRIDVFQYIGPKESHERPADQKQMPQDKEGNFRLTDERPKDANKKE
ncbi:MAG TPA: 6-bladed beta-propeller [Nitrospiria bacterium]|nr:6-bladed beta-propeller [Candidatus Manganitrophaceae bacterium]HIL34400.1 6-bladed beta-propeller [Candidatus Manganitrophaceae bacterium]